MTDLLSLVRVGDLEGIQTLLASADAVPKLLDTESSDKEYALHIAAKHKRSAVIKALLDAGANANQTSNEKGNYNGYTAAHFAAGNDDLETLTFLSERGADLNVASTDGWTPLHVASYKGKRRAMTYLLEHGCPVDVMNELKQTPLLFTVSHGRVGDVRLLLRHGANAAAVDAQGDTLLHHGLHYRMSKLFEGMYDVPEVQLDVAVLLALHGVPEDAANAEGNEATYFLKNDLPALPAALHLLNENRERLMVSAAEWNFLSLVAARAPLFEGLGMEPKLAEELAQTMQELNRERLELKEKQMVARAASGGCPIMAKKPNMEIPTDGSDPSGGKCPFFQKKGGAPGDGAGPAATVPPGHPAVDMVVPTDGSDPSGGQCPFFQKQQKRMGVSAGGAPPQKCPINHRLFTENKHTILLVGISFVCGWLANTLASNVFA